MAKYTMTLATCLLIPGFTLPAEFDQVEGFTELFKLRYMEEEIGFETPRLFSRKLDMTAKLVIPFYLKKLAAEEKIRNKLIKMKEAQITRNASTTRGATKSKSTDLPVDEDDAVPSSIIESDPATDTSNSGEHHEESMTPAEIEQALSVLGKGHKVVMEALLDEFKTCFMCIM